MLKHFRSSKTLNNLLSRAIFAKQLEPLTQLATIKHHLAPVSSFQPLSTSTASNFDNHEWIKIVKNAEKITGYSTSFLSLRYLFAEEVDNLTLLLRKLIKTKHPLIKMARSLISSSMSKSGSGEDIRRSGAQLNGLVVLLISKAVGAPSGIQSSKLSQQLENEPVLETIHRLQRSLAEICDMIYLGSLIHKGKSIL